MRQHTVTMYTNSCSKCNITFETKNPKRMICPDCLHKHAGNTVEAPQTSGANGSGYGGGNHNHYSGGGYNNQYARTNDGRTGGQYYQANTPSPHQDGYAAPSATQPANEAQDYALYAAQPFRPSGGAEGNTPQQGGYQPRYQPRDGGQQQGGYQPRYQPRDGGQQQGGYQPRYQPRDGGQQQGGYQPRYQPRDGGQQQGGYQPRYQPRDGGQQQGGYQPRYQPRDGGQQQGGYQPRYNPGGSTGGGYQPRYNPGGSTGGGYQPRYNQGGGTGGGYQPRYNQGGGGGYGRPTAGRGGFQADRRPKGVFIPPQELAEIEKRYKVALPLPNPDIQDTIGKELNMHPKKVFAGINLVRLKMKLPKLDFPKRPLAVTPDQLTAVQTLYEPYITDPPIGIHKIIAKQLRMDEWRVHVAIKLVRKSHNMPRWNEEREDLPEYMKEQLAAAQKRMDEDTEFQEMKVAHAEKKESDRLALVAAEKQAVTDADALPTVDASSVTETSTITVAETTEVEEDKPKKRGRPKKEVASATEATLTEGIATVALEASLSVAE
jgi:hypothetical protein